MSTVAVNRKSIGEVEAGVRAKRRAKARAKTGAMILNRSLLFLSVSVVAYLGVTISGHIMIDQARRDSMEARARLNTASRAVAGLERRVHELKSPSSVQMWASANGYQPHDFIPALDEKETTIVAQRD